MTIIRMTNKQKADAFFKVATKYLNLMESDGADKFEQTNPITHQYGISPYICDGLSEVVNQEYRYGLVEQLQDEMQLAGLYEIGLGAFDSVEAERRQEARWFFLMFIVECLDNE